jgi:hypothetical protein
VGHADERPRDENHRQADPRAYAVHQLPRGNLTEHHPEVERDGDVAVLRVRPLPLIAQQRRQHRERLAIEQVDRDGRREEPHDRPALTFGQQGRGRGARAWRFDVDHR